MATWTDSSVRILSLPKLESIASLQLNGSARARSILIVTLAPELHFLLVALGSGCLHAFELLIRPPLRTQSIDALNLVFGAGALEQKKFPSAAACSQS